MLREVGATRAQQPGNLGPPHGDRVSAGDQVERLVGKRQRRLVARRDNHYSTRMQSLGAGAALGGHDSVATIVGGNFSAPASTSPSPVWMSNAADAVANRWLISRW
ncbi:hypothetical protein AWC22_27255 [Mycobacterium riyadhense]|uniref:Uncharacterized protein n=1 Tax=Mycobacterium riyadhense TaxID=486698 RepID=A0A1X2BVX0_9MYCO|nr:hypothetical protein AWC22_27255 [Mycobacterium riyadhense]